MYIELQYTLGKLNTAIYVCIEDESDSLAMHLHWSITLLFCIMWSWSLRMFVVLTTYIYTCFAQIARPSATRFISVFDNDDIQILSVDVSTSTAVIYSGDNLTITTSTSFFINKMYYLLADSGVCVCLSEVGMCAYACVCVCMHVFMWTSRWGDRPACVRVCVHANLSFTTVYTWIVLTGVAVATAFCPIESPAITLPTEWPFGVTDTGSYFVIHLSAWLNDAWWIAWLIFISAIYLYLYMYIYSYSYIFIYVNIYIYIKLCGSIYISIFIHIYIHTYIHA